MGMGATPELLAQTFADLGATGAMVRTILLRDRRFAGQRFRCGGMQAVWLAGSGRIAFYDEGGTLLTTVRLEADEQRAA
ncbi:MAG: hypothetical protein ABSG86_10580 [Thermoguttaceae bacterium]|jgi:hypothetical protein